MNMKTGLSTIKNRVKNISVKQKRSALVSVLASALVLGSTGIAYAHDDDGGKDRDEHRSAKSSINYTGPVETTSVADMIANDSWFSDQNYILEGHITKQLTNRTFVFSDGVDELTIKLKSKQNSTFSEKDKVRIKGEYEHDWFESAEFEVKQITVL